MTHIIKVDTTIQDVKTIIHLADIHVRLYKRHQEYESVFNNLYASLDKRDLSNSVIVIAGDIVHAKTDMSPEMIKLTSNFLTELSNRTDTVVIAGNHDCNLSNPHRLDALSPIINNIDHERLHYFKESGIYKFANVEFGVHSIIGDPVEWPKSSDLSPNTKKIALYHAPVNKAQTDVGYSVTNRITVETFNGYDMVLLGDIHRSQILQEKAPDAPEIAYVGSLVQQNHGESLSGHGYMVWNVSTSKVSEFVEVKNDYGYCTVTIDSSKMPSTVHLPKNSRLRVFVGDVDSGVVKKIVASIRKKHNIVEMSINRLINKKLVSGSSAHKSILDNINDVDHQNELIAEYINAHYPNISSLVVDKVYNINTQMNSMIGDDELPKNISWRPIHLKFDNLFSYGEGNEINFDDMDGLYGVFSPNATGKTSAFDAMCFALYDKTPRAFKGSHIMNTRRDTFSCQLEIEIENTRYVIHRNGLRKKTGEVKVDVDFYQKNGTSKISLNGEDRRDTNVNIRSYVGTYEDFILTTLSVQNQNSLFIDTGQSDRKDLLSQFIGMTVFDRLYNMAADQIKEVAGALKIFRKDDVTQKLADLQNNIDRMTQLYDSDVLLESQLKLQIDDIDLKLSELHSSKNPMIREIDPSPIRKSIDAKVIQIDDIKTQLNNLSNACHSIQQQKSSMLLELDSMPSIDVLESVESHRKDIETQLIEFRSKLKVLQIDLKNESGKISRLHNHQYDPNCKYCIDNEFVKDAMLAQDKARQLLENIYNHESAIKQFILSFDDTNDSHEQYNLYKNISNQLNQFENSLLINTIDQQKLISKLNDLQQQIDKHNIDLSEYENNVALIQSNREIDILISNIVEDKKLLSNKQKHTIDSVKKLHGDLSVNRKQRDDIISGIKEAEELEATYEAYELYLSVIGRDGLPFHLMATVIPDLQTQVNNILSQMVDFTLSLEMDGKNINGKILYGDDRSWPLELASGMEKFVSSLAIRVALMSVSNLPKANFLVIDEGLGVLDSENLSSMFMLFNVLKTQFDFIILISHLDVVRDIADELIEIKREDGYSYITVK